MWCSCHQDIIVIGTTLAGDTPTGLVTTAVTGTDMVVIEING